MKKITLLFSLCIAIIINQNVQGQGFLKALAGKGNSSGGSSSGGSSKEVLITDEPNTIFGNYYWKLIISPTTGQMYVNEINAEMPPKDQRIQLWRNTPGKDNQIIIGWGGTSKAGYRNDNAACGDCNAQLTKAGFISYITSSNFVEEGKSSVNSLSSFSKDIIDFNNGILGIYYNNTYCIVISKDKSKIDAITDFTMVEKLHEESKTRRANVYNQLDKGNTMPKVGGANKAPIFAKARIASVKALKDYLVGKGITNLEPIYAYEYFNNPSFDVINNTFGNQIARQVQFYIVCKNNTKSDVTDESRYKFKTNYVVFQTNIREDGSGSSFSGNYYAVSTGVGLPIADTENAMMYK